MNLLTPEQILLLLPLILPALGALAALLVAAFRPKDRAIAPAIVGAVAVATLVWMLRTDYPVGAKPLMGMIAMDGYTLFFVALILCLLAGAAALAVASWRSSDFAHGEFWALLLLAACGMLLLAAATNLLLVFLGVELMSLSVYALVASDRTRTRPTEAALKYFLLGSFSSAFLLFGIAFVYGATGSFDLHVIASRLSGNSLTGQRAEMMLGTVLLLAGFSFKTAAAPFHMWAPDAYTGAPTPITAFMATAVKAASFAAFVRIFIATLVPSAWFWSHPVAVIAAVTVVVGNVGALAQTEVKRLFAYSSVAHAGYLLIGLRAASIDPDLGTPALLYYLFAYGFTTLGAFGVVAGAERMLGKELTLEDMSGFATRHPWYAAAMTVFLLALAGVPPTAGFTAKLYVFGAAVKIGDYGLAVIGVLASAVSLFYYLRVVVLMYMRDAKPESAASDIPARAPSVHAVVAVSALIVLLAGIAPDAYFMSAQSAAATVRTAPH